MSPLTSPISPRLAELLRARPLTIGQIAITPLPEDRFELRHRDDVDKPASDLEASDDPQNARQIAQYDAAGEYRPLKGSPDLKTGWRLELTGPEAVRAALDLFYPAALAVWLAAQEGRLRVVPLSQTLERQTGMYRFARTISPEGATALTQRRCHQGCSRQPLWAEDTQPPAASAESLPLLCPEACSFFVAEARVVAKAEFEAKSAAATGAEK